MKVKIKKTEEEVRRLFFDPRQKNRLGLEAQIVPQWCLVAESRLFFLLLQHKPAGPNKHFNLAMLGKLMNRIYEDEDTDFNAFLKPKDLTRFRQRRESNYGELQPLSFEPKYNLRPTISQIEKKLWELWDERTIENNEYIPDGFVARNDFLPPEHIILKHELETTKEDSQPTSSRKSTTSSSRKRRRGSHESRASTPAVKT